MLVLPFLSDPPQMIGGDPQAISQCAESFTQTVVDVSTRAGGNFSAGSLASTVGVGGGLAHPASKAAAINTATNAACSLIS